MDIQNLVGYEICGIQQEERRILITLESDYYLEFQLPNNELTHVEWGQLKTQKVPYKMGAL